MVLYLFFFFNFVYSTFHFISFDSFLFFHNNASALAHVIVVCGTVNHTELREKNARVQGGSEVGMSIRL